MNHPVRHTVSEHLLINYRQNPKHVSGAIYLPLPCDRILPSLERPISGIIFAGKYNLLLIFTIGITVRDRSRIVILPLTFYVIIIIIIIIIHHPPSSSPRANHHHNAHHNHMITSISKYLEIWLPVVTHLMGLTGIVKRTWENIGQFAHWQHLRFVKWIVMILIDNF